MIFSRGLVSSIIICCLVSTSIAYENKEVHPEINEKALRSSCLENVLQKNGIPPESGLLNNGNRLWYGLKQMMLHGRLHAIIIGVR